MEDVTTRIIEVLRASGFTAEELTACAERELRLRERVYPERIKMGKMSAAFAREEIARMRAVLAVVRALPKTEPVQAGLFGGGVQR